MKATILSCLAVTAGCGFFDAGSPRVIAHRAGGEYWPENSEAAVRGAIAEGFEAIEIDVRLTADRVPVIFHDREISPAVCTYRNGEPIPADLAATLVVTEMTYEELLEWDCCGGPAMTLQELADIVRAAPELEIMLDVKTRDMPWTPEELAATVLEVWTAASPPNPWLVGAWSPDVIRAFRAWGRARNVHIEDF